MQLSEAQINFLMILATVYLLTIIYNRFKYSTSEAAKRYEASGVKKNTDCVNYLNEVKESTLTSVYAGGTAVAATLIMFLIFLLLKTPNLYLLSLIMLVVTFTSSYKVYGCFLYREVCGAAYCKPL